MVVRMSFASVSWFIFFSCLGHVGCWLYDQGSNRHLLHWKVKSWRLDCQRSQTRFWKALALFVWHLYFRKLHCLIWGNYVKLLLLFCEALGTAHQPWELCCSWHVLLYKENLTWTPDWSCIRTTDPPAGCILLAIRLTSDMPEIILA